MPGTCRPERTLVSVHRAGRRDPPTHLARVSSSTLQPETEENLLLSLRDTEGEESTGPCRHALGTPKPASAGGQPHRASTRCGPSPHS